MCRQDCEKESSGVLCIAWLVRSIVQFGSTMSLFQSLIRLFLAVVLAISLSLAEVLQQQHHHHLQHNHRALASSSDWGTETEFEYDDVDDSEPLTKATHRGKQHQQAVTEEEEERPPRAKQQQRIMSVGGFHLEVEQGFVSSSCSRIEEQFQSSPDVTCTCSTSHLHGSAVQFACMNVEPVCYSTTTSNHDNNKQQTEDDDDDDGHTLCARPVHTGTVRLDAPLLSSDLCLKDLQVDGVKLRGLGDLCVSVTYEKANAVTCRARVGSHKCACTLCNDGNGFQLDCPSLVGGSTTSSTQCNKARWVSSIAGDKNSIPDVFVPLFLASV